MTQIRPHKISQLLLALSLILGLILGHDLPALAQDLGCSELTIEGSYSCDVACIARADNHGLQEFTASGEIDAITPYSNGTISLEEKFYQVDINDGHGFTEVEIGPLVGCTLYTSTESVSDNQFPVLESYLFENSSGDANGFTKVVRNPTNADFKSCRVTCTAT